MSGQRLEFDSLPIKRFAFGIRFMSQFGLEDDLGSVIDEILAARNFGPERFEQTIESAGERQLVSARGDETVKLTRSDAILESRARDYRIDELPKIAEEFVDVVWQAVCDHAPKVPRIIRYGALIRFPLPEQWNPIQSVVGAEPADTSEFDMRYVRRLTADEALAMRDVNDYRTVIYIVQTRNGKTTALMDFQHYFQPEIDSDHARKRQPFGRFAERAVAFYRTAGWEFLRTRIEAQLPKAA
jgi:hypothetical protein